MCRDPDRTLLADPADDERRVFQASEKLLAAGLRELRLLDLSDLVPENTAHFARPPA
jgi:hypothetical protein